MKVSSEVNLDDAISAACQALMSTQNDDGHWCFELEGDCTVPAEFILMMHYLDKVDITLERQLAVYLRKKQNPEGGWPLYYKGKMDISCSIKAYYALKLVGDSSDEPHMVLAREQILKLGGAAKANVFTRIALAMFEHVPWRAVPFTPIEVVLLPKWFPFHLNKISYWSRTVMVPLLILCSLKPRAKNPRRIHIYELFTIPPDKERHYFPIRSPLNRIFLLIDTIGRWIEPWIPQKIRRKALSKADAWMVPRLNGEHGLGAIFPAMVNAYEALLLLGYPPEHKLCVSAWQAMNNLIVKHDSWAYCQPCVSPVWDTGLAILALQSEGSSTSQAMADRGLEWLIPRQILQSQADWQINNPDLRPGGWAFEYKNDFYPDLDDTAMVGWALLQSPRSHYTFAITRAADWLAGMQSQNGGFASFDCDNTNYYLNEIPFADHGALLDPPTSDVTARCITFLSYLKREHDKPVISKALEFLLKEQETNGSWFGRWGTNYIYGTWSVLIALEAAGIDKNHPAILKAIHWLESKQNQDGGWGESNDSYYEINADHQDSTSYQTAWALLALMAAGKASSVAVKKGVLYLITTQQDHGFWDDSWFNAPGFPRVFYLRYHGYCKYFPLWALAHYRRILNAE